jgi:hypothetical protein
MRDMEDITMELREVGCENMNWLRIASVGSFSLPKSLQKMLEYYLKMINCFLPNISQFTSHYLMLYHSFSFQLKIL